MALVNSMSVTLLNSPLKCRCLPVAVTLQVDKDGQYFVDPSTEQLVTPVQSKVRLTFNVDTEELIASSMEQLMADGYLTLDQTEEMISMALASAKKIHKMILAP